MKTFLLLLLVGCGLCAISKLDECKACTFVVRMLKMFSDAGYSKDQMEQFTCDEMQDSYKNDDMTNFCRTLVDEIDNRNLYNGIKV
ncbi:hypothetical protein Aduo_003693 [Ancylostoma duodenale]